MSGGYVLLVGEIGRENVGFGLELEEGIDVESRFTEDNVLLLLVLSQRGGTFCLIGFCFSWF